MQTYLKCPIKFYRNDSGATAIEFSILVIPFVLIIVGILELAMMYTASALVETSTGIAARLIRTCQISEFADPETTFRETFCDLAGLLVDCDDVVFEVVAFADDEGFAEAILYPPQFDGNGNLISRGFNPGGVSDIVMIRTAYLYPMITPVIGNLLAGADGRMLIMSTITQKTEPCEFE